MVKPRLDLARGYLLDRFVRWLLGKQSQSELAASSERTWRRQIAWCWQVAPRPELTDEVPDVLLLDGTRVDTAVCLIARTPRYVSNWQWAPWESSATWGTLLATLPPPAVVVCDGQKGVLLAIARHWPEARIQRCLFHVWQNVRAKLTLRPQTTAGQELLAHFRAIWQVETAEQAAVWRLVFTHLYAAHLSFITERTYVAQPLPGQRKWWYTHRGVRSAYRQIAGLLASRQLFTFLDRSLTAEAVPRTTNHVEGGINAQLKEQLKLHRGLNQPHQQRLVDWYLYGRTEKRKPPRSVL
jgi:hypothetical protein